MKLIHYKLYWKFVHKFVRRHQYNRLDTGLPAGYYDPSTQILYAVMNCFRQYMEQGAPAVAWGNESIEDYKYFYTSDDGTIDKDRLKAKEEQLQSTRDIKAELDSIYEWWISYLKIHDAHEAYWKVDHNGEPNHRKVERQMFDLEDQLEVEADEHLARLMKHRCTLWYV